MKRLLLLFLLGLTSVVSYAQNKKPLTGADQLDMVLTRVAGKRVALMANQTTLINKTHLADTLVSRGVNLVKILAVEHGFRGTADAGETVVDGKDPRLNIPVLSIYGSSKKPTADQLADVDVVVFDIQDVGARFFTYISSLHYLMESCAENNKKLLVLDRPDPNGYVDGPVLKPEFKSFVGMHPIPIVHGMTIGEMARMINGEGWLADGKKCELDIVALKNWKHSDTYLLPVRPSPNLPNNHSVVLYPSTCLMEGTQLSVGRGTQNPFEFIGHPSLKGQPFSFTPMSIDGMAKHPPLEDELCYGLDLRSEKNPRRINLSYIIAMYNAYPDKENFFTSYIDKLAGNKDLKEQIKKGMTEDEIRATWKTDLDAYQVKRKKYLLYP